MNNKKNIILSIILIIIAVIYTILVKAVDVQLIERTASEVGFATINNWFWSLTGHNEILDKITDVLLIVPVALVGIYAFMGCKQLITEKSLAKVDKKIIAVGCFYVVLAIIYVLFEKVIINYRPILVDGELEASFPSSHTLMAICVCMSSVLLNKRLWKSDVMNYMNISIIVVMALIVFGRLMAGVHWLSDILGGVLISSALVQIFNTILNEIEPTKR